MKLQVLTISIYVTATLSAGVLDLVLPRPRTVVERPGYVSVDPPVAVVRENVSGASPSVADQAYRLVVSGNDGVTITASTERGERLARATLAQLAKLSDGKLPCCEITDWPEWPWRGLMHDCGRNYLDLASIKKILDLMAVYKLNLFHWHLTDYYGWRLESKLYPMLQAPWAFRRHVGKFYTQKEFREIIDYAAARGITVMPELDVPGHSLAFRRGLGIEFMAEERVKTIVGDLIDELCSLATPEEMPFIHLGTDEARTPYEMVPDAYCPYWAERVIANGRMPVAWTPGKPLGEANRGKVARMIWREGFSPATDEPAFDTAGCYFGSMDPFRFLNAALSPSPCAWEVPQANRLGTVICSWHDDYLGEEPSRVFVNCNFALAAVAYADLQWSGRGLGNKAFSVKLPAPGTPAFAEAERIEDRIVAQRDRVLPSLGLPVAYVRQTPFRWRLSTPDGKVVAKDSAQATVTISKCGRHFLEEEHSYLMAMKGVAVLETWIHSAMNRQVGAWIGFTNFGRSGGRRHGLPPRGEWGRSNGITVEINGEKVPAPDWVHPGLQYVMTHPEEATSDNIAETAFTNEEYFMREPTPIRLRAGWNHVRLVVPKAIEDEWTYDWLATFAPVTLEKVPREVEGLIFSSDPKDDGK